jgi:hypothetical protein
VSKKILIDHQALKKIQDMAIIEFHNTRHTPEDSRETQIFLILKGFHAFLVSQGIDPQFTVKPAKDEPGDCTPLDDL